MNSENDPFCRRLDALSGAHNFTINDLQFIQAQNVHRHQYNVMHSASGQLLELFQLLNPIKDASHKRNRQISPPDSHCLPGPREQVFGEVRSWINGQAAPPSDNGDVVGAQVSTRPICWLYGFVGCGKSAIAQNIAEEYARKSRLAASFFFFRNAGDRSTIDRFAATLAHQISLNVPGAKALIEQAIMGDPGLIEPTCSVEAQLEYLVYKPLIAALEGSAICGDDSFLLLVDGLDECMDKEGISTFIDHSIDFFSRNPTVPLRLLITSRIEEHIRTHIEDGLPSLYFLNLVSKSNREDVACFMKAAFEKARKHDRALKALGDTWPDPQDMDKLVDYCDGSFIFASTLARFILGGARSRDPRTPMERLPLALKINPGLDGVYTEVLSRAKHLPHFHIITSTVALVQTHISISGMSSLLGISTYAVIRVLVVLQAILQVPGRDDVPVTLFHTSLRDFLVDKARSGDFYCPPTHHTYLAYRCLDLFLGMDPTTSDECCKYAIMFWAYHLCVAARSDSAFDLKVTANCPYKPVDADDCTRSAFKARWKERRPLVLFLSEADWAILLRNMHAADAAIRAKSAPEDIDEIPSYYYRERVDKDQWLLARTEGYGRSCPPIVRVDSSHTCSIRDLVQGFCTMMCAINKESWKTHFAIRRGEDIAINIEFYRTASAILEDNRRKVPGGSQVTISDDLRVGLHSHTTLPC